METNLLDRMLNGYLTDRKTVTVTLQNKIRVSGRIKAFDSYVIILEDQKQEILYRHAVSSLSPFMQEETRQLPAHKSSPARTTPAPRPKSSPQRSRSARPDPRVAAAAPAGEASINNSMKEELLKWMQEQKAK